MNSFTALGRAKNQRCKPLSLALGLLILPLGLQAGGVVTECTESALRAAMAGGGAVTFACDGTITLTQTITNTVDTTLDASGHQITISGGGMVRVFYIATNGTFAAKHLKISNGRSSRGAGILNDGGMLKLSNVGIESNYADSYDQTAQMFVEVAEGGGLLNLHGEVTAVACNFTGNTAYKLADDSLSTDRLARGGAICNEGGVIQLRDCLFASNQAVGAPPMGPLLSPGRDGLGGAIHNSGHLTAMSCSFISNSARGEPNSNPMYPAPAGGSGFGGAIYNVGDLVLLASTVASNRTSGGTGGSGVGGCVMTCPGNPTPGGPGSNGGSARGGGLFNAGTATAVDCTIAWNGCVAGAGGPGGNGGSATLPYVSGTDGGSGGSGGSSLGGGVFGAVNLTNCTLAFNSVTPGAGGSGGAGGSAIPPSYSGQPGASGTIGLATAGGTSHGSLIGTLLATNLPGSNSSGALTDLGHNISSDGSCNFTNVGSLNNTDPKLGPLVGNGGPTLTMALLAGSPAIDAGDNSAAPATDQRGIPRPFGVAADIGAYEYAPFLSIHRMGQSGLDILLRDGSPGQTCRLLTSTNFTDWLDTATNQVSVNGACLFQLDCNTNEPLRWYRTALP